MGGSGSKYYIERKNKMSKHDKYVVIVSRWYLPDDTPTIVEVFLFKRYIEKSEFLDLYPSYRDDIISIEYCTPGE